MIKYIRLSVFWAGIACAGVGDPQLMTDHPWYPGELAISSFERLAKTQARAYERVTGKPVKTDEDKALAAWLWRNTHFAHGEDGKGDTFDQGFGKTDWNREYWHGMFAHGFALCGATHAQWTAEMEYLLGPCRGRAVGVSGHNSFEVWLTGGAYGDGRWALLDHDVSTVIFDDKGERLLGIREVMNQLKTYKDPYYKPERQRGWRVAGLHDGDAATFDSYRVAEYKSGYAGAEPIIHLRRGETLRRYLKPGLADGKTFVFWGRNYKAADIPGPSRDRSWVNQPDKMYGSKKGAGWVPSRVRYANAVYTYTPDFSNEAWKEGMRSHDSNHVSFSFQTPYVIAATPGNDKDWGIYDKGCRNGLVVESRIPCRVYVSTDGGCTYQEKELKGRADLTDAVKGHQQYLIRFDKSADELKDSGLTITTVCQANVAVLPRLTDGMNRITYGASGRAVVSAGPNKDQADMYLIKGTLERSGSILELGVPKGKRLTGVAAASWNKSGAPPQPVTWSIETSVDRGDSWQPLVAEKILRRGDEPGDFWSQSFTYGQKSLRSDVDIVQVRFSNDGGKGYRKLEAYAYYDVGDPSPVEVRFAWRNGEGGKMRKAGHRYAKGALDTRWTFDAGENVETVWVEMACP